MCHFHIFLDGFVFKIINGALMVDIVYTTNNQD